VNDIPEKLFVTGTDTEIGKTVISASLVQGMRADYWKPVQAGTEPITDTEQVRQWTDFPGRTFHPETYRLKLPMSPHAASADERISISMDSFKVPDVSGRRLITEGAGGLLVPLNDSDMILDLIVHLNFPVLLVSRSGLGTINHTLLSLKALRDYSVPIWGVVLNGPVHKSNEEAIRFYGRIDNLFTFPVLDKITPETLNTAFIQTFT
jgi:dethiobiotin synthetase